MHACRGSCYNTGLAGCSGALAREHFSTGLTIALFDCVYGSKEFDDVTIIEPMTPFKQTAFCTCASSKSQALTSGDRCLSQDTYRKGLYGTNTMPV